MTERIKLFTDSDLDGVSCGILASLMFKDNVDITYCTPKDIDKVITEFIESKSYIKFNKVFITDLVLKEETGELINQHNNYQFRLFDHHRSNYVNSKYQWAYVHESISGIKTCGTELLWNHFKDYYWDWTQDINHEISRVVNHYVELVRMWDTWDWTRAGESGIYAKDINTIFTMFGAKKFCKNIVNRINDNTFEFIGDTEREIIDLENGRKKRYINQKMNNVRIIDVGEHKVGYVFAENYISELGNYMAKNVNGIKYAAIINADTSVVSLRAIEEANINLAEIAKSFSAKGGGHPLSAGFVFNDRLTKYMVEDIFGLNAAEENIPEKKKLSSLYGEMNNG